MADNTPHTLTIMERVQLANQFRILQQIDENESDHWAKCKEIVESGYTIMYGEIFQGFSDELDRDDCVFVFDVLDMYRDLKFSYGALPDKTGIDEYDVTFRGFDGNNETEYYSFIGFLKEQGRWSETLENCGMNSHSPTVDRYRVMIPIWKNIRKQYNPIGQHHDLTADEIKQVLDWKKAVGA